MTEPSIIAAEPPNPLVNELIIMPDIEKRLEAFVRIAHGIIIFPGGVGTAEELLYLLGILMNPANKDQVLPLILTGPKESADYFRVLDEFVVHTLGENARRHYRIIIDDAAEVARQMKKSMPLVKENRRDTGDAYSFNWSMRIAPDLQMPFEPSHENMANLKLYPDQPVEVLAADLRRAFSGIVAGNVKEVGIRAIEEFGPYKINGDKEIMRRMDDLLQAQPTSLATKSARNLPSPGDVCCRVFSFLVTYSSTHFICYMNVSYHPHATNITTVNMSYNLC